MKAVVLRGPRDLVLADVPRPKLRDENHVLIRVQACGICGSDLRYWAGENPWALHTLGKHVDNPPNMILGHEFAGIVEEVNASRFEHLLGKRVGVQAFQSCGRCALCKAGHENLCKDTAHIGHARGWGDADYYPGAYAEYCPAWGDLVLPMEDHVTFAEEALRDILGVAVHAVSRCAIPPVRPCSASAGDRQAYASPRWPSSGAPGASLSPILPHWHGGSSSGTKD